MPYLRGVPKEKILSHLCAKKHSQLSATTNCRYVQSIPTTPFFLLLYLHVLYVFTLLQQNGVLQILDHSKQMDSKVTNNFKSLTIKDMNGSSGSTKSTEWHARYTIPCKYYKLGTCKLGDQCRFSHSKVCRHSVQWFTE